MGIVILIVPCFMINFFMSPLARDMLGVDASSSICRSSHLLLIPWAQLPDRREVGITTGVVVVVGWVEENRREVTEE